MEKRYTIKQSCAILDIDASTLLRWCKVYAVTKVKVRSDGRIRLLTEAQLREMAEEHGVVFDETRMVLARHKPAQQTVLEQLAELRERIEILERQRQPPRLAEPEREVVHRAALPDGMVGWQAMARIHGIPKTTAENAVRRRADDPKRLPTITGTWKEGATHYREILDPTGQRRFWELFRSHPRFKECPHCPHTL